jgi:hypothetical protein
VNGYTMRFALAWLVSIGAACTSAPIRHYTLIPPPDETLRASEATLAIDVAPCQKSIEDSAGGSGPKDR